MTCNYFEYKNMTEELFYGVPLTEKHLNYATEKIRQYLLNGGAGNIMKSLGIGIRVIAKEATFLPSEIVSTRFVWLCGERKGKELCISEIENIGMFLKHGAFYGRFI